MKIPYVSLPKSLALCLSLVVAIGSGCVHLKQKNPARAPLPLPEALAAQVSYPKSEPRVLDERVIETREKFRVVEVDIESFVPMYGTNKTLTLECYIPHGATNADTILDLPVSAGKTYPLDRRFLGPYFARHGYVLVLVHRENLKGVDEEDPRVINWLLAQSVLDERRAIDWIETRAECNPRHIGVLGVSMGAIKGALVASVDERVRGAVLVLGGADIPDILTHSKEGAWQKRKKGSVERSRGISGRREAYMRKYGITLKEFERRLRAGNIVWDPKEIGRFADSRKFCLVFGLCDNVVPFKNGMLLRKSLGKPETKIVVSGHYTSLFYLMSIERTAHRFFQQRFSE